MYLFTFLFNYYKEVNATFLARYIAKKITYGHRLKYLLNPLKRELKRVSIISLNRNWLVLSRRKNFFKNRSWVRKSKIWWRFFLSFLL